MLHAIFLRQLDSPNRKRAEERLFHRNPRIHSAEEGVKELKDKDDSGLYHSTDGNLKSNFRGKEMCENSGHAEGTLQGLAHPLIFS